MLLDMLRNILSIIPRVVTLSLFASYELYWFWGLVGSQIVIITIICFVFDRVLSATTNFLMGFFFSLVTGVGMVFRMFITFNFKVYFYFYLLYWFLTFTENTAMISLWYIWNSDTELCYHDWAISGVIVLYFLSLVVKVLHSYFNNKSGKNIMKWVTLMHNHVCDPLFEVTFLYYKKGMIYFKFITQCCGFGEYNCSCKSVASRISDQFWFCCFPFIYLFIETIFLF